MSASYLGAFLWTFLSIAVMLAYSLGWLGFETAVVYLLTALTFGVWVGALE